MIKFFLFSLLLLCVCSLELPLLPLVKANKEDVWNIQNVGYNNKKQSIINLSDGTQALKVVYPKGSYEPSKNPIGGLGIYASPPEAFAAEEATFTYQLYFDDNFEPVLGGKLPGLYVAGGTNKSDIKGGSGGDHSEVSTVRIMWRQKMAAETYVYLPYDLTQDPSYEKIPGIIRNKEYGDSLWRGELTFKYKAWNDVSIHVIMNTVGVNDGLLEVTINGVTRSFNKLGWRQHDNYKVSFIDFETFFGGSTTDWATPIDTYTLFRNINIETDKSR